jgi:RsiW-degrading membrane proteinase PrsW (M82 family)
MAGKVKIKATRGWISKVHNCIKSMSQEEKGFWGPVAIALGFTAVSNGIMDLRTTFLNSSFTWEYLLPECIAILFGLTWFVFGICMLINDHNDRKLKARIGITAGFSAFFIGVHIMSTNLVDVIIGSLIIIFALISIVAGICLYRKDKADNKNSEQKQRGV